jgi:hypothetical protein
MCFYRQRRLVLNITHTLHSSVDLEQVQDKADNLFGATQHEASFTDYGEQKQLTKPLLGRL